MYILNIFYLLQSFLGSFHLIVDLRVFSKAFTDISEWLLFTWLVLRSMLDLLFNTFSCFERLLPVRDRDECRYSDEDINGAKMSSFLLLIVLWSWHTAQSEIDSAASLHWLRCLLFCCQVCTEEKRTKSGEKTQKNTLIPICIYSSHRDELKNSFLLISWIICSLCINHGAPSERCRRHSVRNSHSDLN